MVIFTDSQEKSATIASTSKTQIGQISVPKGRTYTITRIWFGSAQKGVGILSLDILPSMQGRYVFNAAQATYLSNESQGYPTNIAAVGPCTITMSTEQAAATSNTVRAMINYVDSTQGA